MSKALSRRHPLVSTRRRALSSVCLRDPLALRRRIAQTLRGRRGHPLIPGSRAFSASPIDGSLRLSPATELFGRYASFSWWHTPLLERHDLVRALTLIAFPAALWASWALYHGSERLFLRLGPARPEVGPNYSSVTPAGRAI